MNWLGDVYLICAVVGGTLLVVQTVLVLLGVGAGEDIAGGEAGSLEGGDVGHVGEDLAFFKWLSVKTVVACLTFFGLAGLAAEHGGMSPWASLGLAVAAGTAAIVVVAFVMTSLAKLQSRGNVRLENAVGRSARVYLRVPGARQGVGKVTVAVQGRSVEVAASTGGPEIPTGAQVRVLAADGDVLDVAPL